jgi:hypothetical protein
MRQQAERPFRPPAGPPDADQPRHGVQAEAPAQLDPGLEDQQMVLAAFQGCDEQHEGLVRQVERVRGQGGGFRWRWRLGGQGDHGGDRGLAKGRGEAAEIRGRRLGIGHHQIRMQRERGEPARIEPRRKVEAVLRHHQRHAIMREAGIAQRHMPPEQP